MMKNQPRCHWIEEYFILYSANIFSVVTEFDVNKIFPRWTIDIWLRYATRKFKTGSNCGVTKFLQDSARTVPSKCVNVAPSLRWDESFDISSTNVGRDKSQRNPAYQQIQKHLNDLQQMVRTHPLTTEQKQIIRISIGEITKLL